MARMKDLIASERKRRAVSLTHSLEREADGKKKELETLRERIARLNSIGRSSTFAIEKKYNGFRATIHKKGESVRIFSDQGRDVTFLFPTAVNQAKRMSGSDFIVDCRLVPYKGSKPLGRDAAARFIRAVKSGRKISDGGIVFFAFDCPYFGRDITGFPWSERKNVLNKLKATANIKKTASVIAKNRDDALKAINMFNGMRGSEGAVIKRVDSRYEPNKESDGWIEYKAEAPAMNLAQEGPEIAVTPKNFPSGMQQSFRKVMDSGKFMPFVMQWHYRGHPISTAERSQLSIPEKYQYKLDSLHTDFRMTVNGHLQGITLLSPTSTDPSVEDKVSVGKMKSIRAVLKSPQPKDWLKVDGVFPIKAPGTTAKSPALFIIVAKGGYLPRIVEDHRVVVEIKEKSGAIAWPQGEMDAGKVWVSRRPGISLKKLPKYIQFQIAHIEDRYIILVNGRAEVPG